MGGLLGWPRQGWLVACDGHSLLCLSLGPCPARPGSCALVPCACQGLVLFSLRRWGNQDKEAGKGCFRDTAHFPQCPASFEADSPFRSP